MGLQTESLKHQATFRHPQRSSSFPSRTPVAHPIRPGSAETKRGLSLSLSTSLSVPQLLCIQPSYRQVSSLPVPGGLPSRPSSTITSSSARCCCCLAINYHASALVPIPTRRHWASWCGCDAQRPSFSCQSKRRLTDTDCTFCSNRSGLTECRSLGKEDPRNRWPLLPNC